jgi:DNA-binding MarR family transcriptional regulator
MGLLADEVILSKSGVTRLIDRLVTDGLVERGVCLSDARGAEAVLTEAGLARMRAASRTHLRGISEHFLDVVDPADLESLERSMTAVARRAGPVADTRWAPPDAEVASAGVSGARSSSGAR